MDVLKDGVDELRETIEKELEQKRALKVSKISKPICINGPFYWTQYALLQRSTWQNGVLLVKLYFKQTLFCFPDRGGFTSGVPPIDGSILPDRTTSCVQHDTDRGARRYGRRGCAGRNLQAAPEKDRGV